MEGFPFFFSAVSARMTTCRLFLLCRPQPDTSFGTLVAQAAVTRKKKMVSFWLRLRVWAISGRRCSFKKQMVRAAKLEDGLREGDVMAVPGDSKCIPGRRSFGHFLSSNPVENRGLRCGACRARFAQGREMKMKQIYSCVTLSAWRSPQWL